jgi:hypothetical protein
MLALTPKIIIAITRYQALPGSADPEALPPSIFPAEAEPLPPSIFPAEAEPLDIGSQAEPRNQLISYYLLPITNEITDSPPYQQNL